MDTYLAAFRENKKGFVKELSLGSIPVNLLTVGQVLSVSLSEINEHAELFHALLRITQQSQESPVAKLCIIKFFQDFQSSLENFPLKDPKRCEVFVEFSEFLKKVESFGSIKAGIYKTFERCYKMLMKTFANSEFFIVLYRTAKKYKKFIESSALFDDEVEVELETLEKNQQRWDSNTFIKSLERLFLRIQFISRIDLQDLLEYLAGKIKSSLQLLKSSGSSVSLHVLSSYFVLFTENTKLELDIMGRTLDFPIQFHVFDPKPAEIPVSPLPVPEKLPSPAAQPMLLPQLEPPRKAGIIKIKEKPYSDDFSPSRPMQNSSPLHKAQIKIPKKSYDDEIPVKLHSVAENSQSPDSSSNLLIRNTILDTKAIWDSSHVMDIGECIDKFYAIQNSVPNFTRRFYLELKMIINSEEGGKSDQFWNGFSEVAEEFLESHQVERIRQEVEGRKQEGGKRGKIAGRRARRRGQGTEKFNSDGKFLMVNEDD